MIHTFVSQKPTIQMFILLINKNNANASQCMAQPGTEN